MRQGMQLADFVKVSLTEAQMLSEERDPQKAALDIQTLYGMRFLAVTLGEQGSIGISQYARLAQPAFAVDCVDTTGAGDAFWGAALHRILALANPYTPMDEKAMAALLKYASAAGSLATAKYGALPALASHRQIAACVKQGKLAE